MESKQFAQGYLINAQLQVFKSHLIEFDRVFPTIDPGPKPDDEDDDGYPRKPKTKAKFDPYANVSVRQQPKSDIEVAQVAAECLRSTLGIFTVSYRDEAPQNDNFPLFPDFLGGKVEALTIYRARLVMKIGQLEAEFAAL